MDEPTRCEAQVPTRVTDEHGKKLPDEWARCEHDATVLIRRSFSGMASANCGTHARAYYRREALGHVTITELKGE